MAEFLADGETGMQTDQERGRSVSGDLRVERRLGGD